MLSCLESVAGPSSGQCTGNATGRWGRSDSLSGGDWDDNRNSSERIACDLDSLRRHVTPVFGATGDGKYTDIS